MIYLSGVTNDVIEPALVEYEVGLMVQPESGYARRIPRYATWAADNGCFAARWEEERWLTWLDRLPRDGCLFAVAPDVYPDAAATLERSSRYFALVREMGFPVALVAQDGAENLDLLPWDDFDCLFVGGEKKQPEWKVGPGAERLVNEARSRGKWVHMGRANSQTRLARARSMGCHSADGTFLKWPDTNLPRVRRWLVWLEANQMLPAFNAFEGPSLPIHREAAS